MKDLSKFGTSEYPLRASSLDELVKCTWRAAMLFTDLCEDTSGQAADTGSATHAAVAEFHRTGGDIIKSLKALRGSVDAKFRLADTEKAERFFANYSRDPRNKAPEIVELESEVTFTLEPHATDPTGAPIVVLGHLDQIRRERGQLKLWDLKTGSRPARQMLMMYTLQIAAYCIGATAKLGESVQPGGLIRTDGYNAKGVRPESSPDGVFLPISWRLDDCMMLLERVQLVVAQIRSGEVWVGPGDQCSYCPALGLDACLPKLRSLL